MTQPVATDKFSTLSDVKQRKFDAPSANGSSSDSERSPLTRSVPQGESADVGRANERLVQQLNEPRGTEIRSSQQARERVAQLQLEIASDPAAVVRAFGNLNQNAFEAAIAEPSD